MFLLNYEGRAPKSLPHQWKWDILRDMRKHYCFRWNIMREGVLRIDWKPDGFPLLLLPSAHTPWTLLISSPFNIHPALLPFDYLYPSGEIELLIIPLLQYLIRDRAYCRRQAVTAVLFSNQLTVVMEGRIGRVASSGLNSNYASHKADQAYRWNSCSKFVYKFHIF